MNVTRRNFVQALGTAAAALGLVRGSFGQDRSGKIANGLFAIPGEASSDPLTYLSVQHFEPFIGTTFDGRSETGRAVLVLTEVVDLSVTANTQRGYTGPSYSLLFEPAGRTPAEDTYLFDHPALGQFTLHVAAVDRRKRQYEGVVNRIARPSLD